MVIRAEFESYDEMLGFCRQIVSKEDSAPERPVLWVGPKEGEEETPIGGEEAPAEEQTEAIEEIEAATTEETPAQEETAPEHADMSTVRTTIAARIKADPEFKKVANGFFTELGIKKLSELKDRQADLDALFAKVKEAK